ncbi:hypothetical protein BD289DRAFT_441078 [Coniella lustricola]|uniref:Rhodopsin domain-containing protein n=1 Tax=Coniella lustricola TaxID=2025994 RepID=A0A2T2ZZT0_9PEZI|nr:hypothetical protein BD289DRAFT_441078 [Coniella lustricola]
MSSNSTESQSYLDYDKGPLVIRVITAILTVATLFVALRIYVRLQRARDYGLALDDWLSVASVVLIWAEYINCVLTVTAGGVGLHLTVALEKKPNALRNVFLNMYSGELIYFTGVMTIKWSVLAMYYRIFPTKFMKWGYIALGAINFAWWIGCMFATIFQCTPIHDYWDLYDDSSVCINANVFYLSTNGIPNIVMDALILCLPMWEVYKLHLGRKVKIAIGANFLIGALVLIASIYKLTLMVEMYYLGSSLDVTYYLANLVMWWIVEPSLGIISAALPTLRPVLVYVMGRLGLGSDTTQPSARPGLVTFGQGNSRGKKRTGYTTTGSIDQDIEEQSLNTWPELHHGKSYATVGVGSEVQLSHIALQDPRTIAVQTEVAWKESRR